MSKKQVYGTRTIKRNRRSKAEMGQLDEYLLALLEEDHPQTVRGAFYQATVRGWVPKTEAGYRTVQRALMLLREHGELPFDHIADSTRWMRKPRTFDDMAEALNNASRFYRKALWNDQDVAVEVWMEKDALAGVVYEVTAEWDVPLMVTRGYSSLSFLHQSALVLAAEDRPCFIYCLGDHDPSGVDISRNVEQRLRQYAPDAEIHFERIAVTPEQIKEWDLPSRPTKTTDTRAKGFDGDSVELDAIPAWRLRQLVLNCISMHIDPVALEATRRIEAAERKSLHDLRQAWAA
jgi:hypothetical protein